MRKENGQEKTQKKRLSRRDFIKKTATAGTVTMVGVAARTAKAVEHTKRPGFSSDEPDVMGQPTEANPSGAKVNRQAILFAIGDTLIPSLPGDPGYRDLEWYGITEEINRRLEELPDEDLDLFNRSSAGLLQKKFTDLSESQRGDYFNRIVQKGSFKNDALQDKVKEVYSRVREVVFIVYYQNFPQDHWPLDANRVPLLKPGDEHQITNPNTSELATGWDLAGYSGPLTWDEEERRRNYFKKIRWQE
jgi:hypothetical protein